MKTSRTVGHDRGVAIVLVLVVLTAVLAAGLGLVSLANTDRAIASNFLASVEARLAAEAVLERAFVDVRLAPDLSLLTSGAVSSGFRVGTLFPLTPSGQTLDLAALTTAWQATVDTTAWGGDSPVWHLFAHGPIAAFGAGGDVVSAYYGVVWLADDVNDGDNDPAWDTNGVVQLLACSFGPRNARHAVAATIAGPGIVTVHEWRDVVW